MATRYPQNRRCRAGHYDSNVTAENLSGQSQLEPRLPRVALGPLAVDAW